MEDGERQLEAGRGQKKTDTERGRRGETEREDDVASRPWSVTKDAESMEHGERQLAAGRGSGQKELGSKHWALQDDAEMGGNGDAAKKTEDRKHTTD